MNPFKWHKLTHSAMSLIGASIWSAIGYYTNDPAAWFATVCMLVLSWAFLWEYLDGRNDT